MGCLARDQGEVLVALSFRGSDRHPPSAGRLNHKVVAPIFAFQVFTRLPCSPVFPPAWLHRWGGSVRIIFHPMNQLGERSSTSGTSWGNDLMRGVEAGIDVVHVMPLGMHFRASHESGAIDPYAKPDGGSVRVTEE